MYISAFVLYIVFFIDVNLYFWWIIIFGEYMKTIECNKPNQILDDI